MKANIVMQFGKDEYVYGTYEFNTPSQRNWVNELAMKIRKERECQTYVERIED